MTKLTRARHSRCIYRDKKRSRVKAHRQFWDDFDATASHDAKYALASLRCRGKITPERNWALLKNSTVNLNHLYPLDYQCIKTCDIKSIMSFKYRYNLSLETNENRCAPSSTFETIFKDTFRKYIRKKEMTRGNLTFIKWEIVKNRQDLAESRTSRDSLLCVYRSRVLSAVLQCITNNKKPIWSHFWSAQSSARNARVKWTSRDLWRAITPPRGTVFARAGINRNSEERLSSFTYSLFLYCCATIYQTFFVLTAFR